MSRLVSAVTDDGGSLGPPYLTQTLRGSHWIPVTGGSPSARHLLRHRGRKDLLLPLRYNTQHLDLLGGDWCEALCFIGLQALLGVVLASCSW